MSAARAGLTMIAACLSMLLVHAEQSLTGTRLAITVDDLPANGDLLPGSTRLSIARGVLAALKRNGIQEAYGFANGHDLARDPALRAVLDEWAAAGYPVGNHSFGHLDLHRADVDAYLEGVDQMDGVLAKLLPSQSRARRRVYRYPFLTEGNTATARDAVRAHLARHGYRIAPVTVDYYDWAWNAAYTRCRPRGDAASIAWLTREIPRAAVESVRTASAVARRLFGRDVPHVLLIHVGDFDAVTLDGILQAYRREGVRFVSLGDALEDPAYRLDSRYTGDIGLTFLEQVATTRGIEIGDLQVTPYTLARLNGICAAS